MTEENIQIIQEKHTAEDYEEQKIIFDNSIFEKVKGKELDLNVDTIFNIPIIKNLFKRQKEEYYVVSQEEHIIDRLAQEIKKFKEKINNDEVTNENEKNKALMMFF